MNYQAEQFLNWVWNWVWRNFHYLLIAAFLVLVAALVLGVGLIYLLIWKASLSQSQHWAVGGRFIKWGNFSQ